MQICCYCFFKLLYVFSATITLGDNNNVASIVGMAIRAKKLSIRFIIKLKDVVAPIIILKI